MINELWEKVEHRMLQQDPKLPFKIQNLEKQHWKELSEYRKAYFALQNGCLWHDLPDEKKEDFKIKEAEIIEEINEAPNLNIPNTSASK